jgi:hypothetical protein
MFLMFSPPYSFQNLSSSFFTCVGGYSEFLISRHMEVSMTYGASHPAHGDQGLGVWGSTDLPGVLRMDFWMNLDIARKEI